MKISELGGELALIELIRKYSAGADGLEMGIGDDAALVRCVDRYMIVTTDLLIEQTHFRMDINQPYLLGWKSAAVNISDIAAMGGHPTYTFVSIGLPDVDVSVVEGIYQGMRDVCDKYGSVIAGGDTVSSECGIVINITQIGEVEPENAALRSKAMPGDAIIVTNTLGDSSAGLKLLLGGERVDSDNMAHRELIERHLRPEPRVREARAAVQTGSVHAMMDLSDGLAADLPKLCAASGVGATVYADRLPISDHLRVSASELNAEPYILAAAGGEDYELLITCAEEDAGEVIEVIHATGTAAGVIGKITDGDEIALIASDGLPGPFPRSWEHF